MSSNRRILSHRDLHVWQRSIQLALCAYHYSSAFPRSETYGLTSQLRRASISIAANIAEGNGRKTARDYAHFLAMAIGSTREVDTLLVMAEELEYGNRQQLQECQKLLDEVGRMLNVVHATIDARAQLETRRSR
ncbi:four helix bundle protein [bacterium]|nr:four helix bundle protein [bacterium]